jgi:hypothetical protein
MNKKESRTKSSRISPERRGRKPAPNCGVWTADEMEIRENWDFAAVPTEEAIEALAHELKREAAESSWQYCRNWLTMAGSSAPPNIRT